MNSIKSPPEDITFETFEPMILEWLKHRKGVKEINYGFSWVEWKERNGYDYRLELKVKR